MDPVSVLLVDDNPTFLRIATRFLQEHYRDEVVVVGTAGGGQEALIKARDLRPQVILLDLAMPDLPGLEAIPRLRAALPEMGIIALTVHNSNGYRQAALAAGADEFVSKANLSTDLLPAIRRVMKRET
jgi:DNA-binding NarL/FixJ family response regulator